ncbi:hypothetical protein [Saccharibacillus sacchari]|uniref:Uncharacterized protein n=1 Tax=Saccharibacillus sacchari TaxID=456493 RepID=A0ACC6P5X1_9BACL
MKSVVCQAFTILTLTATLWITGCASANDQPFESITTSVLITEKAQSDDLTKKWLIASNANTDTIAPVRIEVENEMVWNLIQPDREYFVAYAGSPQSGYVLEQIEQTGTDGVTR